MSLSSLQVPGQMVGGALRLPHVQQTNSWASRAASQHRDSTRWTGVILEPAWAEDQRSATPTGVTDRRREHLFAVKKHQHYDHNLG